MTREEQAIAFLKKKRNKAHPYDVTYYDMAIAALKKENIYDDKEHYVTISKALYDKLNIDYEALSQEPICDRDCEHCTWTECPIEPCDDTVSIRKDVLKRRVGKLVVYNVEWLKKHWQMEMDIVCGVKPCDDAISREAVIDITWEEPSYTDALNVLTEIRDKVEALPSVTQKPETVTEFADRCRECGARYGKLLKQKSGKWIPVSEKLPEAFSFVNCTCHSLIDDRENWVVETCYIPQLPDSPYSDWGNIPMLNMGDCEVVAWMYRDIPKPYKVEPQESEDKE